MRNKGLSFIVFVFAACMAFAQGPPGGPEHGGFGPRGGEFGGFGFRPGKVLAGAPYTADSAKTVVQTLSDGNSITRTTTGHVARDAAGRTYAQETLTGGLFGHNGPTTITFISDPVAGFTYALNATTKVAMRRAIKPHSPDGHPEHTPPVGEDGAPLPPRNNVTPVDLGTQVVNGVSAKGKSVTHTIPAGEFGNAQPIVSTSETWFSPDLQVLVSSKHTDPRTGTATFALTNIQRAAPAATLFQVPSDYTVQDAPQGGPHRHPAGAPPPQQ
jgi:hypothetical protein